MRGEPIAYLGWKGLEEEHSVHYVSVESYPGGEPLVTEKPKAVQSVLLRPKSTHEFIGGLLWLHGLKLRGNFPHTVILPYFPGARQDRMNDGEGDQLFTAKAYAELVNSLEIENLIVLDPHSNVTPALLNNCSYYPPSAYLSESLYENKYNWVLAPDAGSDHRAVDVATTLGVPVSHGWKVREVSTGKLIDFGWDKLPLDGSKILVVDDICDGGGTFIGLANKIKADRDVTLDLFVTHGLFTKGTRDLLQLYNHIYTTDSVVTLRPDVTVDNVCLRLLEKGIF